MGAWVGCLDYQVQVQRGEELPKQLNQLTHPGWKTALDNVALNTVSSTNESAVLQKPEIFLEDPAITLEVRCNASMPKEESNVTESVFGVVFEKVFEVDQPLEMTDEDEATMENQAEMGDFSQILTRSGLGNADEPKTSANTAAEPESAVKHEHAAETEPSTKSNGNLNSFVSLSLFLATFIIKSF